MSSFGDRLLEERNRLGLTQNEFGERACVRKQAQLMYEKDARHPNSAYLAALIVMGVDVLYILTGRRDESTLSPDEAALLDDYRKSTETGKRAIRGAASASAQPAVSKKETAA